MCLFIYFYCSFRVFNTIERKIKRRTVGNVMKLQAPGPESDIMVGALILMKWGQDMILYKQQI